MVAPRSPGACSAGMTRALKKTYHEIRNGWIPASRKGGRLVASKSRIKAAYLAMTASESRLTAPAPAERVAEPAVGPRDRRKRAAASPAAAGKRARGRARVPIAERPPSNSRAPRPTRKSDASAAGWTRTRSCQFMGRAPQRDRREVIFVPDDVGRRADRAGRGYPPARAQAAASVLQRGAAAARCAAKAQCAAKRAGCRARRDRVQPSWRRLRRLRRSGRPASGPCSQSALSALSWTGWHGLVRAEPVLTAIGRHASGFAARHKQRFVVAS
jgi:hypothetical protein